MWSAACMLPQVGCSLSCSVCAGLLFGVHLSAGAARQHVCLHRLAIHPLRLGSCMPAASFNPTSKQLAAWGGCMAQHAWVHLFSECCRRPCPAHVVQLPGIGLLVTVHRCTAAYQTSLARLWCGRFTIHTGAHSAAVVGSFLCMLEPAFLCPGGALAGRP